MCQVFTKAFMQSGISTKMACIEKKNEFNLKTNVEDTKFSFFFFSLTNVDVLSRD